MSAFMVFLWTTVFPARGAPGYDLAPLAGAGRLVATGRAAHLYAHDSVHYNRTNSQEFDAAIREVGFELGATPYVYPPLVAVAMQPLSNVRFPTVMRWWTLVSALCLVAALWLTLELYLPRARKLLPLAAGLLALSVFEPVRYSFWLGQTTPSIFFLVLLALALQRRGQLPAAGIALALAAFVKLTPIVLAVLWLWRGPRRACVWFAGALTVLWALSLATMGTALHVEYVSRVRHIGSTVLVAYNNHSLLAFLTRRRVDDDAMHYWLQHVPAVRDQVLLALLVTLVAGVGILLLRRIPRAPDDQWRPIAEGLCFVAILLVPSIAWTHYFVMLLPVLAVAIARFPLAPAVVYAAPIAVFLLCTRLLMPDQVAFDSSASHIVSAPTFAALIALGVLIWLVRAASPAGGTRDAEQSVSSR